MIAIKDLAWTAGFLEGEGSFGHYGCPRVSAAQVQRQPIDRLQRMFGGTVWHKPPTGMGKQNVWTWTLKSRRSVEVMMTLFSLMSPKRQEEIADALAKWRRSRLLKETNSDTCAWGHKIIGANLAMVAGYAKCRQCRNATRRRWRAGRKAKGLSRV